MTKEQHNELLQTIRTTTDEATKSNALLELEKDYTTMLAESEESKTTITDLTANNKTLAEANNKLWLERTATTEVQQDTNADSIQPNKRKFEDLDFS